MTTPPERREPQPAAPAPAAGSNFELVKGALDDLFRVVETLCPKDQKTPLLVELAKLSASYKTLTAPNRPAIDYSSPLTRFAYVYTYVAAHSSWVYNLLIHSPTRRLIEGSEPLRATCLGGGPGTELVALIKACTELKRTAPLLCFQIDSEDGWTETWADVGSRVGAGLRVTTLLRSVDVLKPPKVENLAKALDADLFFAVFFLSEIYSVREQAATFLHQLAASMKSGALMVYLDNNSDVFNEYAKSIFTPALFEVVYAADEKLTLSANEEKRSLGRYYELLGRDPRLTADASIRIWRKK
jgi:hypothetical protein